MAVTDPIDAQAVVEEDVPQKKFLELPSEYSSWDESSFVVIPAPLEATVTWGKGTALGPSAIIDASRHMEVFDLEAGCEHVSRGHGICTLKTPWSVVVLKESKSKAVVDAVTADPLAGASSELQLGDEASL